MASIWDPGTRDQLVGRVASLRPDTVGKWGKMTCPQMVAHLNAALRMASGDLPVEPRNLPLRFTPLKQLVIYVLPFPKGAPTASEIMAGPMVDWSAEHEAFASHLDRVLSRRGTSAWPAHPAFGTLTERAWGVLVYRHTDHHLTQFGA